MVVRYDTAFDNNIQSRFFDQSTQNNFFMGVNASMQVSFNIPAVTFQMFRLRLELLGLLSKCYFTGLHPSQ